MSNTLTHCGLTLEHVHTLAAKLCPPLPPPPTPDPKATPAGRRREYRRDWTADLRRERKRDGVCTACGKAPALAACGGWYCANCQEKRNAVRRNQKLNHRTEPQP